MTMRFTPAEVRTLIEIRIDRFFDDPRDLATAANATVVDTRRIERLQEVNRA